MKKPNHRKSGSFTPTYYGKNGEEVDNSTFINVPFVNVPMTGGLGFGIISALLVAAGAIWYIRRRHRERQLDKLKLGE